MVSEFYSLFAVNNGAHRIKLLLYDSKAACRHTITAFLNKFPAGAIVPQQSKRHCQSFLCLVPGNL